MGSEMCIRDRLVGIAEYQLAPSIFKTINSKWGPITLDAFAGRWNRQVNDPRDRRYFRCYDGKGELIELPELSKALHMVIATDGFCELNYLNPKDPRKCGS